jgi:hypothetical protein
MERRGIGAGRKSAGQQNATTLFQQGEALGGEAGVGYRAQKLNRQAELADGRRPVPLRRPNHPGLIRAGRAELRRCRHHPGRGRVNLGRLRQRPGVHSPRSPLS